MDASQQYHDPQSSYRRPVPGQLHGHTGVVRDAEFLVANAAGNHLSDEDRVDRSPPVENTTAQGQPQGLQYFYYDMPDNPPPPHEHRNRGINNYVGVALDVPTQAQAAPPVAVDIFDEPTRNVAGGPAQAFLYERPQQDPVPHRLTNEVLRQLAILYLREPNSQVVVIRMEPGHDVGFAVTE